jgi:hypothetical protein
MPEGAKPRNAHTPTDAQSVSDKPATIHLCFTLPPRCKKTPDGSDAQARKTTCPILDRLLAKALGDWQRGDRATLPLQNILEISHFAAHE